MNVKNEVKPICRVCNSDNLVALPIGKYAEFFQARVNVYNDEYLVPIGKYAEFFQARNIFFLISRIRKRVLLIIKGKYSNFHYLTYCQYCIDCRTVTPSYEFSQEELYPLYRDYRMESYNKERIIFESSYKKLVKIIGVGEEEIRSRNLKSSELILRNKSLLQEGYALDFGGADGMFIPQVVIDKYGQVDVYDVSIVEINSVLDKAKVVKINRLKKKHYSFLMSMHVLEHIGNPLTYFKELVSYVKPGGLIYLEFPLELSAKMEQDFINKSTAEPVIIHEHINQFSQQSVIGLVNALKNCTIIDSLEDNIGRYLIKVL